MKKFMIIGVALMLAAFSIESKEAIIEIKKDETLKDRESGRILYKWSKLNDEIDSFVETYVHKEVDNGYDYRVNSVNYSEEDHAIKYSFDVYDVNHQEGKQDYELDVFASPESGVQEVKLRAHVA